MNKIGNKIIQLNVVNSTNNFAANLLKSDELVHGTVILADEQSAGKGQRGATWQSEGGSNLIFTVFVEYDNLTVEKGVSINQWIALSMIDLLSKLEIKSKIKWPNDIFVENKKIAGILIENQVSQNKIKSSIIGIGLNVNQIDFGELNATSVQILKNQRYNITEIAWKLIASLNDLKHLIENEKWQYLNDSYHAQLWNLNKLIKFKNQGLDSEGIIEGVTEEGNLKMNVNGNIEIYQLKEISFVF